MIESDNQDVLFSLSVTAQLIEIAWRKLIAPFLHLSLDEFFLTEIKEKPRKL